jgi:hypothetical protein
MMSFDTADASGIASGRTDYEAARFASGFKPRKLCQFFLKGNCSRGEACTFAHNEEELHPNASNGAADCVNAAFEAAMTGAAGGPDPTNPAFGRVCDDPREPAAELSFVSCAMGPREFQVPPAKALCRYWLQHPTACFQGDYCTNAHGLAEIGYEQKLCNIRVGSAQTCPVSVETGKGGYGPMKGGWMAPGGVQPYAGKGCCKGGFGFDGGKGKALAAKGAASAQMAMLSPPSVPGGSRFTDSFFKPTKLCQFWVQSASGCQRGDACTYAHGVQELQPSCIPTCGITRFHHRQAPGELCSLFLQGQCARGLACPLAHSDEEFMAAYA